jgi:hypothetical protein
MRRGNHSARDGDESSEQDSGTTAYPAPHDSSFPELRDAYRNEQTDLDSTEKDGSIFGESE